jgi:photosystem II stability/assembly factor-like uncharacterized protein
MGQGRGAGARPRGCAGARVVVRMVAGMVILVALLLLLTSPAAAPPTSFPDVPESYPYHDAILELASRSIVSGYTGGNFGPTDAVLRQQFAKMIVLTGGYPVSEADICPFSDVELSTPPSLFPDHYVAVAAAHQITVGTSPGIFSPGDRITRFQVISMVVRAADDLQPGLLAAPPSSFAGTAGWVENDTHGANARRAEFNGLLAGLPLSSLDPWGDMPRGEVAQVLYNLLQKLPTTTTTSGSTTSSGTTTTTGEPRGEDFEEHPFWSTSNLAVTRVWPDAERTDPEVLVTFTAQVENRGPADANSAMVEFSVDGTVVFQAFIRNLPVGGSALVQGTWWANGPGRHTVRAEVQAKTDTMDLNSSDNWAEAGVWVAGEAVPKPELMILAPDFSLLGLTAGVPVLIPLTLRNPSFAATEAAEMRVYIDDSEVFDGEVQALEAGSRRVLQNVPWTPTEGEHVIRVVVGPSPSLPDGLVTSTFAVIVPGQGPLYSYPAAKDQWASLGPQVLDTGDAGRIADAVFDPVNPATAYAVSEVGGIWKTTNLGDSWFPIGDKLPTMRFALITVDPKHPEIIYACSYDQGLWKSTDGGVNWSEFALGVVDGENSLPIVDPKALVVRHPNAESEQFVIYLACQAGVMRYVDDRPFERSGVQSRWSLILDGPVWDMSVHPDDAARVWAVVDRWELNPDGKGKHQVFDRIVNTSNGVAGGKGDWTDISGWLPKHGLCKIDVSVSGGALFMFAAIAPPAEGKELAVYRSMWGGPTWEFVVDYPANNDDYWKVMYNPFIRIDRKNPNYVYVAGVQLFRLSVADAMANHPDHTTTIPSGSTEGQGHPDIKGLVFIPLPLPGNLSSYWVLSDGGVWEVIDLMFTASIRPRNTGLRNLQLYHIGLSADNPNLMLAGTQDNGMIRFTGSPVWDVLGPEGDTDMCLISALDDRRMYLEGQCFGTYTKTGVFISGLHRTDDGLAADPTWTSAAGSAEAHLPADDYNVYCIDPTNQDHLLAAGERIYETTDAGGTWQEVGPFAWGVGLTQQVLFRPGAGSQAWVAGTSTGQVWYHDEGGWHFEFEHPVVSGGGQLRVISMAFAPSDNTVLYVLFGTNDKNNRIVRLDLVGNTWKDLGITELLPGNVAPHVICVDARRSSVLYVGTDHGVWRGVPGRDDATRYRWAPYNDGMPLVKVDDLQIDKTTGELRAATNGRGAWTVKPG